MTRLAVFTLLMMALPSLAWAQQAPQVTNEDLLKLLGLQQVQNLQCGKALEAAQAEVVRLTPKPVEPVKEKK